MDEKFDQNLNDLHDESDLHDRLDQLENANARLQDQVRNMNRMMGVNITNPDFDVQAYRKFIIKYH